MLRRLYGRLSVPLPAAAGAACLAALSFLFVMTVVPSSVFSLFRARAYGTFDPPPQPIHCIHAGVIGEKGTLVSAMAATGVPLGDAHEYATALAAVFDPRRATPDDSFSVLRTEDGSLLGMRFFRSITERYSVFPTDTGYAARREDVRVSKCVRGFSGAIETSLWNAMHGSVEDVEVILSFADMFAWQIDFLTEPRPGDRFRLVYEVLYVDTAVAGVGDIIAAEYYFADDTVQGFIYPDTSDLLTHYDADGQSLRKAFLKAPLQYRRISSHFSYSRMHPILRYRRPHLGVDYSAPSGTPVSALGDGTITFRGWKGGFGNYVEIAHGGGYATCYGHLSRFAQGQSVGARVRQGEVIGFVGSTGLSTGPHLDFRIRKDGHYRDPLTLDMPPAAPLPDSLLPAFRVRRDELLRALYDLAPLGGETKPPVAVCRSDTTDRDSTAVIKENNDTTGGRT